MGKSSDWDQFSTNERLFGVRSNYDETFYTTTINKNDPEYAAKAARAEKIAREIESSSALNSHVREERGGQSTVDETNGDEEDKYSGVRRDFPALASGPSNRYTPPARRAPTAHSTVAGAPVDPAIISSSLARPTATPAKSARAPSPAVEKATTPDSAKTEVSPPISDAKEPLKETAPKSDVKTETKTDVKKETNATAAETLPKPSTAIKAGVAGASARKVGRPHDATTNVEHDLLDSFKQFSAAEKLRMSERQRAFARENKAVKLNDLKKFAQNFKLSTPVPSDLVPILAKDETKQQAIVEKALRQAAETKPTPTKTSSNTADPKPTVRPATKPDSTNASPNPNVDRQQNQRPRPSQPSYNSASLRERPHQNVNQIPPRQQGLLSTRLQLNQQQLKNQGAMPYNGVPQPIPAQDPRLPPAIPSQPSSGLQTPNSTLSSRFNVRANEFKPNPAAHTFQPGGAPSNNSSPRPNSASKPETRKAPVVTSFFSAQRPTIKSFDEKSSFNAITRLEKEAQAHEKPHSDIPPPYRTPPTWDFPAANTDKSHLQLFDTPPVATPLSAPQHMMGNGPMPHQHQLPPHLQGPGSLSQGPTPQQTPRGPPVQPHLGQNQHHYEAPHMQFSQSNSSIQPSPRPGPHYMYGGQPQQMPGFPQQVQVPQYGMSPNIQHVTLRNAQGGHFITPPGPAMGGQMMTNQPSNGPYMNMPNPQMQMYSPAPGPAYPQYPGHMPGPGANGYPNSPRPGAPMMSQQGSQQGHLQQGPMMYMQPGAPAPQMYQMQPGSSKPNIHEYRSCFSRVHSDSNERSISSVASRSVWLATATPSLPAPAPRHTKRQLFSTHDATAFHGPRRTAHRTCQSRSRRQR